jgi:hypothetical protein
VGLAGIEPATSALSVLVPSRGDGALNWGFVVQNLCCCPHVPHPCQTGTVECSALEPQEGMLGGIADYLANLGGNVWLVGWRMPPTLPSQVRPL